MNLNASFLCSSEEEEDEDNAMQDLQQTLARVVHAQKEGARQKQLAMLQVLTHSAGCKHDSPVNVNKGSAV